MWGWISWWIGLLAVPWLPGHGFTATHAGWLWLAVAASSAVLLGAVTPARRPVHLPGLALVAGWLAVSEAWRWRSLALQFPWTYAWGAWCDTAGWGLALLAGTLAVLRHAPSPSRWLSGAVFGMLTGNLLVWASPWSRWAVAESNTGLFPGPVVWAGWCVVAWPLLWAWRRWAVLPAVLGLLVCPTTSAWLALAVGGMTSWRVRWRWRLLGAALLVGIALLLETRVRDCVSARLATWAAVGQTIAQTPLGIGWAFRAYDIVATHASRPILPHPASDWWLLPLRYGWWMGLVWLGGSVWLWRQPRTPGVIALRIAWWLAAWQTSISLPALGGLVWLIWLTEQIGVVDHGSQTSALSS